MTADPTHRHDQFHRGLVPSGQLASGTPADGDVPIYDTGVVTWGPQSGGPDLSTIDFLVGTASGDLSSEIVVGTTPGGELGGTWASPTVDSVHSGSAHHDPVTVGTGLDISGQLVTLDLSEVSSGGELGGTMDAPTVDTTHSGSAHSDFIAKAIVDAKGDLIAGTAADTVARVAVGTDGYLLTADSGATAGVSWQAPGSSSGRWELAVIPGSPPDPLYADGDFLYIFVP